MMNNDINKLEIYREAMRLGEVVWGVVAAWDFFANDTAGKQFVRAVDSSRAIFPMATVGITTRKTFVFATMPVAQLRKHKPGSKNQPIAASSKKQRPANSIASSTLSKNA
jgi:hypothetical protein